MSEVLSLEEKVLEAQEFIRANLSDSNIPTAMMFSGGKDSVVVRHLLESCGINHVKYYYMASGIEGPYLKNYLLENYPDVEWLIPKTNNIFEEWKQRKYPPYLHNLKYNYREQNIEFKKKHYYCCFLRFQAKAATLKPYTNIIMGVRNADNGNTIRYPERIVSHQGKNYYQPIYNFTKQDIFDYAKKHDIELCKEYDIFGSTRSCPICPICPIRPSNYYEILKENFPDIINEAKDVLGYCYDNNPYLQEQFSNKDEYIECFFDKNKFRKKVYEENEYFIDPETGLKYSNETGSVVM